MAREAQRFVDQRFVRQHFAPAHAGIRGYQDFRLGVVDARRQARGGEAAEHHRMDRADAHRRQHREHRLGNHRHVQQHAVAALHALRLEQRSTAIDFGVQFRVGIRPLLPGFGRDKNQRWLVAPCDQVTIERVMAKIGTAADEPAREGRPAIVEHLRERRLPVDQRGALAPVGVAIGERARVAFPVGGHRRFPQ